MIFECVNFNAEVVAKMSKDEFTAMHINVLWQDRDEATRKKMLTQVYGLITKPAKESKRK